MKVFISSVVTGFEDYRSAAAAAVGLLRHEVILAERYPAIAGSPQQACLQGVRDADVTVVVLGARYGAIQLSGMSATHEELVEARNRGVAIALVQDTRSRTVNLEAVESSNRGLLGITNRRSGP